MRRQDILCEGDAMQGSGHRAERQSLLALLLGLIALVTTGVIPGQVAAQTIADYPTIEIVDEASTLVYFGSEWSMWADIDMPPEGWPMTSAPTSPRPILDILAPDHEDSPDQYIRYGSEFAPSSGWEWTSVMTPVVGRSEATHASHQDRWDREERRRIRRHRAPPQRTNLFYTTGAGPSTGGMDADPEPGIQNLYFVRSFEVADASAIASLQANLEFAGGIIVYLNGEEILRHHVAPSHDSFGDAATPYWLPDWVNQTTATRWERSWLGIDPGLLQTGTNTIAVGLYKRPAGGTKAFYFDLQLDAYEEAGMTKTPYLQSLDHESIIVDWETNVPAFGYVEFGPEGEAGFQRVAASAEVAGTLHEVRIDGLTPDTRYYYRVHSFPVSFVDGERPSEAIISETRHFMTSVNPGTPFSFVAYGDTRTQSDVHAAVVEQMWGDIQRSDARFVVHTGDLTTTGASWEQWQREFFTPALPLLGYIPFYTSLGNHEGNHEMYYRYLSLPGNEAWYSFTHGDVEFFAINSSFNYREGSLQYNWLEEALGASTSQWKVIFLPSPALRVHTEPQTR